MIVYLNNGYQGLSGLLKHGDVESPRERRRRITWSEENARGEAGSEFGISVVASLSPLAHKVSLRG